MKKAENEHPYGGTIYMLMLPDHPVINIVNLVWQPFFDGYLMVLEKKAKSPDLLEKTDALWRKVIFNRGEEEMKGVSSLQEHIDYLKKTHDIVVPDEMIKNLESNLVQGEPTRVVYYLKTSNGYERFCYDVMDNLKGPFDLAQLLEEKPTYH